MERPRPSRQQSDDSSFGLLVARLARADGDPRQIVVEQYTGDNLHATYTFYRCWVSDFQALPDLDANANMVAIELVQLEHEGVHVRPGG